MSRRFAVLVLLFCLFGVLSLLRRGRARLASGPAWRLIGNYGGRPVASGARKRTKTRCA